MYQILSTKTLNPSVRMMVVKAPLVARKAEPGQFIVLRVDEYGERIPLTVADYDRAAGTVTIIFQVVGATTSMLAEKQAGDSLADFAGPLGTASHLEGIRKAAVIGGGVGCAIAWPQAKKLHDLGAQVDVIAGFRSKDIIILEDELKAAATRLFLTTDDGSNGRKGFVTDVLRGLLEGGEKYDEVIAIGPLIMMKMVCRLTKSYGVKTVVSMNPIMIDGTGMCGGCRVTVGGKMKFACVDGPDFDGQEVDFDETMRRNRMYQPQERKALDKWKCNLIKEAK